MEGIRKPGEGKQTVRSHPNQSRVCFLIFNCPDLPEIRLKLKALHRFTSTATAVEDITALQGGKLGKGLKQFLTDEVVNKKKGKESLIVVDQSLGEYSLHLPRVYGLSEYILSAF